jgi:hypothetical protein
MDIRAKIQKLPISVHWKWVGGHQDNNSSTLDEWAKANVMVDHIAKAFWNHLSGSGHTPAPLQFGNKAWAIHFQGQKLNPMGNAKLYQSSTDPSAKEYWRRGGPLQVSNNPK